MPSTGPLRVTMLLYGEVDRDTRVRREAATLVARGHSVTIVTLSPERRRPYDVEGAHVLPVRPGRASLLPGDASPLRAAGQRSPVGRLAAAAGWATRYGSTFASWAWAARRAVPRADVWHGHDLLGLFAARALQQRHGGALVYDSHELFLEAGSAARLPGPARAALARLEGAAARMADAVITVNQPIAAELRRRYGVDPIVVMNCPPLLPPVTDPVMRGRLGLGARPVVVHHGVLGPGRGLEVLADAIPELPPDVAVVLLGGGPLFELLAARAASPELGGRLFVVPAVPAAEVRRWIADADVGVIPFEAVDRNNQLATPNKLFEYLEAGVPMVVSEFPEMTRIVRETGAGLAADTSTPSSLATAIRTLLEEAAEERAARRAAARTAAETTYNWAAQSARLIEAYERVAGSRKAGGA